MHAVQRTYDRLPEGFEAAFEELDEVGFSKAEIACMEAQLPILVPHVNQLVQIETKYRVAFRGRPDRHVRTHLETFEKLVDALQDPTEASAYMAQIQSFVDVYRNSLTDYDAEASKQLMASAVKHVPHDWGKVWMAKIDTWRANKTVDTSGTFLEELIDQMRQVINRDEEPPLPWPSDISDHLSYRMVLEVIERSFAGYGLELSEDERAVVYRIYVLKWQLEPSTALYFLCRELRRFLNDLGETGLSTPESRRSLTSHLNTWRDDSEKALLSIRQRQEIDTRNRAVWFFDIKGSSTTDDDGVDIEEMKRLLFGFAKNLFTRAHGRDDGEGMEAPVMSNTWGDAMIAVYNDPESAVAAAMAILKFAMANGITLRFGGAYGPITIKINPALGLDAFGATVDMAARLEPVAWPNEFLADRALGQLLWRHKVYQAHKRRRKLKKAVGKLKVRDVDCYTVHPRGSARPTPPPRPPRSTKGKR